MIISLIISTFDLYTTMTNTIVTHTTTYNLLDLPQQETVGSTIVIDRKYASDGTVMQVNHYYPYGGLMTDPRHTIASSVASDSRYRFTGKELSEESGEYDFGARYLDPIPGRFTTLDPLAEKYYNLSPYTYCIGNPIRLVDPNGMDIYLYDKKTGQLDLYKTTGDEFDQIGKLKRNRKKGDIRIMINNIEKGILDPDGMNFHSDTRIDLTGINGPSLAAVEDFLLDFSNMIDTEVGGYYVSEAGQTDVRYVTIGTVSKNTSNNAVPESPYNALFDLPGFSVEKYDILVNYHTHLSRFSDSDRLRPSSLGIGGGDIGFKDRQQSRYPSMQFLIITNPKPFYY